MLRLLASSLLVAAATASFCGDSAVPFSIEVLPDGQPILGCTRPSCFGWAPNGQPATTNNGAFYQINGRPDGFVRPGPASIPAFGQNDARYYRPYVAMCDLTFSSTSCAGLNQWVGGIAPQVNATVSSAVLLQCCALDSLVQSEDRGVASISGGQMVQGGEVVSSGLQVGFDYISNVAKVVRADGTVQYDVSVRRMSCADPTAAAAKTEGAAQAFQAPNLPVDQPLPLPPAQVGQNAVLEQVIQEEAIQLPPGTQFQPALQPPPPPQFQPVFQPQFVQQPPAPAYSPPVQFYGGGNQAQWCFTGDMTVRLGDNTTKRMDELTKKDWVLAVSDKRTEYVPVEFWLHRVPAQEAEFNEFETEDGKTIKLTDKHYIFKGDCSRVSSGPIAASEITQVAVTADQVSVGDCLFTFGADKRMREVRVVRSGRVVETGIYAPMTSSGRIIVNDIHASCHNIMQAHSMGSTVFGVVDTFNQIYDAIFGSDPAEIVETPNGLNTILSVAEMILPERMFKL